MGLLLDVCDDVLVVDGDGFCGFVEFFGEDDEWVAGLVVV